MRALNKLQLRARVLDHNQWGLRAGDDVPLPWAGGDGPADDAGPASTAAVGRWRRAGGRRGACLDRCRGPVAAGGGGPADDAEPASTPAVGRWNHFHPCESRSPLLAASADDGRLAAQARRAAELCAARATRPQSPADHTGAARAPSTKKRRVRQFRS